MDVKMTNFLKVSQEYKADGKLEVRHSLSSAGRRLSVALSTVRPHAEFILTLPEVPLY